MLYRFKTFKSTFYFPALTEKNMFIYSLYGNYGGRGAHVLWWLFTHSKLFRWINRIEESRVEDYDKLSELLGGDCVFGVNTGTKGPDQKKSILGYDINTGRNFFAKLSTSERAKTLTRNEIKVHQALSDTDLIPKLYEYSDEKDHVFMKCECLDGRHVHGQIDNQQIMDMLLLLKQKHYRRNDSNNISHSKKLEGVPLQTCFAHMDFCPWNMLDVDGHLRIIDWEMADEMPLGFDLFTYLLQTYFLTVNIKTGCEVISENEDFIDEYFCTKRNEWQPYLDTFIDFKIEYFSKGQNDVLLQRFKEMKNA